MDNSRSQVLELPGETMDNLDSFTITMWVKLHEVTNRINAFLSVAGTGGSNELLLY